MPKTDEEARENALVEGAAKLYPALELECEGKRAILLGGHEDNIDSINVQTNGQVLLLSEWVIECCLGLQSEDLGMSKKEERRLTLTKAYIIAYGGNPVPRTQLLQWCQSMCTKNGVHKLAKGTKLMVFWWDMQHSQQDKRHAKGKTWWPATYAPQYPKYGVWYSAQVDKYDARTATLHVVYDYNEPPEEKELGKVLLPLNYVHFGTTPPPPGGKAQVLPPPWEPPSPLSPVAKTKPPPAQQLQQHKKPDLEELLFEGQQLPSADRPIQKEQKAPSEQQQAAAQGSGQAKAPAEKQRDEGPPAQDLAKQQKGRITKKQLPPLPKSSKQQQQQQEGAAIKMTDKKAAVQDHRPSSSAGDNQLAGQPAGPQQLSATKAGGCQVGKGQARPSPSGGTPAADGDGLAPGTVPAGIKRKSGPKPAGLPELDHVPFDAGVQRPTKKVKTTAQSDLGSCGTAAPAAGPGPERSSTPVTSQQVQQDKKKLKQQASQEPQPKLQQQRATPQPEPSTTSLLGSCQRSPPPVQQEQEAPRDCQAGIAVDGARPAVHDSAALGQVPFAAEEKFQPSSSSPSSSPEASDTAGAGPPPAATTAGAVQQQQLSVAARLPHGPSSRIRWPGLSLLSTSQVKALIKKPAVFPRRAPRFEEQQVHGQQGNAAAAAPAPAATSRDSMQQQAQQGADDAAAHQVLAPKPAEDTMVADGPGGACEEGVFAFLDSGRYAVLHPDPARLAAYEALSLDL